MPTHAMTLEDELATLEKKAATLRARQAEREREEADERDRRQREWAAATLENWPADVATGQQACDAARRAFGDGVVAHGLGAQTVAAYLAWHERFEALRLVTARQRRAADWLGVPAEPMPHASYAPLPLAEAFERALDAAVADARHRVASELDAELAALDRPD
jgi:hypothetical protein